MFNSKIANSQFSCGLENNDNDIVLYGNSSHVCDFQDKLVIGLQEAIKFAWSEVKFTWSEMESGKLDWNKLMEQLDKESVKEMDKEMAEAVNNRFICRSENNDNDMALHCNSRHVHGFQDKQLIGLLELLETLDFIFYGMDKVDSDKVELPDDLVVMRDNIANGLVDFIGAIALQTFDKIFMD